MLTSNKTFAMPTLYHKKSTMLTMPPWSSDWSTVLELTLISRAEC